MTDTLEIIEKRETELKKRKTLQEMLKLDNISEVIKKQDNIYTIEGRLSKRYLVLTRKEAEEVAIKTVLDSPGAREIIADMLKHSYHIRTVRQAVQEYINHIGRGNLLATYDGIERKIDGIFIYRLN